MGDIERPRAGAKAVVALGSAYALVGVIWVAEAVVSAWAASLWVNTHRGGGNGSARSQLDSHEETDVRTHVFS